MGQDRVDIRYTAPREWPRFSYLYEEGVQQVLQVLDTHPSTPLLKDISDYDIKLVQRLLYYTASDLWLSEKDKDWHFPLLITLREQDRKTGGTRVLRVGGRDGNNKDRQRRK